MAKTATLTPALLLLTFLLPLPSAQAEHDRETAHKDRVEYLIDELLHARDDDDREDAAEDLGKIGDTRALDALKHAAIYDDEDDVRDEASKAIKRIHRRSGKYSYESSTIEPTTAYATTDESVPTVESTVHVYRHYQPRRRIVYHYDSHRHYYPRYRPKYYFGWSSGYGSNHCW